MTSVDAKLNEPLWPLRGRKVRWFIVVTSLFAVFYVYAQAPNILNASTSNTGVLLDIPSQDWDRAMKIFAKQADINLLYSTDLNIDRQTLNVFGSYLPAQGLNLLLYETGLGYEFVSERTVTIISKQDADPGALSLIQGTANNAH